MCVCDVYTDAVDSPGLVCSLAHTVHLQDPQRRVEAGGDAEPAVRGRARPPRRPLLHGPDLLYEERSSGAGQQRQEEELKPSARTCMRPLSRTVKRFRRETLDS